MKKMTKKNMIIDSINKSLINLPSPSNLSFMWNFGSLLGLFLLVQITSGLLLSIHYTPNITIAFDSMNHIYRNMNNGWMYRIIHSNGASFFFLCIYIHMGRGMYYNSFMKKNTWFSGIVILFILMATAFLGYVLPWGQMSFWGATVITNLLSSIPYIGNNLTYWMWGGFSINNATLNRFFSFHFIMPFILSAMVMMHLIFLHEKGSSNPLNLNNSFDKIPFNPFFSIKDLLGFTIIMIMFFTLNINEPFLLNDSDNFIKANPLNTPPHIQPEWYFLFAYAILRSIPNKLGGVIALVMSIMIMMILPFTEKNKTKNSNSFSMQKIMFWTFSNIFISLTWLGSMPIEYPFIMISQIMSTLYFLFFLINPMMNNNWNKILSRKIY
uniref:Cytochrome b n=1 Tax=Pseudoneureclipsis sibuyana TaxID=2904893 RepID=A0A9E8LP90_9NEOP|nr:cytochrome b [Pseudoneureclipsis sibuyana]UZZ44294.1 cytochrome b [Pseudoneureclipsis sibuyana]